MKRIFIFLLIILLLYGCHASQTSINNQEDDIQTNQEKPTIGEKAMRNIQLTIQQEKFEVELENNSTVEELLKRLPMTLSMKDLNNNEKYNYLKEVLPTHTQNINTIEAGDVMLFGNNCLVIFYESFPTSYQYTRIGKIKNVENLKEIVGTGDVNIELKIWEEMK